MIILLAIVCSIIIPVYAEEEQTIPAAEAAVPETVYVIPIKGVIERALLYVVRRGLSEADKKGAAAVIFDMDTPGGLVSVTEEIIRMLIDLPENIKTYTFVNKDALSAGSFISVATDEIYMTPGSRIGASAIITAFGDLPEGDTREKAFSALSKLVTSAAERNGHDKLLVESMIRKEKEYKIGEEIICPVGELLTLSDTDAARIVERDGQKAPLLSAGTFKTLDELTAHLGLADKNVIHMKITTAEKIARYIELFAVLFLIGGILGIYIEFKTPGFGVPGITGIILLAIFFWGHRVAGLSGDIEVILFFLGILLLILEIFFIPGFGVAGVAGLLLVFAAIAMSLVEHIPGGNLVPPINQVETMIKVMSLTMFGSGIFMVLLAKYLPETPFFDRVSISATSNSKITLSCVEKKLIDIGMEGTVISPLRPAGTAEFNGKRIDVVSNGDFIAGGAKIVISEIHGNRVVVRST